MNVVGAAEEGDDVAGGTQRGNGGAVNGEGRQCCIHGVCMVRHGIGIDHHAAACERSVGEMAISEAEDADEHARRRSGCQRAFLRGS